MLENIRKLFPGGGGGAATDQGVSLEHLREILDTIEVKFGQMKTEYATYRETTEGQLQKAAEVEKTFTKLQAENKELTNQVGELEKRVLQAETGSTVGRDESDALKAALERERAEKQAMQRELEAKGTGSLALAAMDHQVRELQASLALAEKQVQDLEDQKGELAQQVKTLAATPKGDTAELQELQASREYWENRSRELEAQQGDWQQQRHKLVAQYEAELDKAREQAGSPDPEMQRRVIVLQDELKELHSSREQLEKQTAELQLEKETLGQQLKSLESAPAKADPNELQELQASREYWENRARELEAQQGDWQQQRHKLVAQYEAELDKAREQASNTQSAEQEHQLATLRAERERLVKELEEASGRLVEQASALEGQMTTLKEQRDQLGREVAALQAQLHEQPAEVPGQLQAQQDEFQKLLAQTREENSQLAQNLQQEQAQRHAAEERLQRLEQDLQQAQQRAASQGDQLAALKAAPTAPVGQSDELARLQQSIKTLQEENVALQQRKLPEPGQPEMPAAAGASADRRKLLRQIISH